MSLTVNFTTHSKNLSAAYQAVISDSNPTNWLVYAYDKNTNDLRVQDTGEELNDEFSDGKVQYALARVIDPNSQLPKIVFIGWCGTGVPENRKAFYNAHLIEVSKFFKTFHVQINARDEADVEPDLIMKRVSESSGAKYSVHKESAKPQPAVTPVNSVYKKTEIPDIAAMQRQSMKKEGAPAPVGTNYKPVQTAPKPLASRWQSNIASQDSGAAAVRAERERAEKEAREREEQSARERDLVERQRAADQERAYQQQQQQQREAEDFQRQKLVEEDERRKREQEEENRRLAEEQRKAAEEEEYHRQVAEEQQRQAEEQRKAAEEQRKATEEQQRQAEEQQRQAEEQQRQAEEQQRKADEEQQRKAAEEQHRKAELEKLQREEQEKQQLAAQQQQTANTSSTSRGVAAVVLFSYEAGEANEMSLLEGEVILEIDQVDEGWWYGVSEDGKKQGLFPSNYVEVLQEDAHATPAATTANHVDDHHTQQQAEVVDLGHTAIGLYDYQAGEENEISFKENERITNIEFASDDWWQGLAPDGKSFGLFPANYVNLEQ
ncbi:unnamed protein product [Cunninghamella blakesleeana]